MMHGSNDASIYDAQHLLTALVVAVLAHVKGRIEGVEVLGVKAVLCDAQGFTKTGRLK